MAVCLNTLRERRAFSLPIGRVNKFDKESFEL